MINPLDIQLKNIHNKLQQLLKQFQSVQKENSQLKKELDKVKLENDQKTTQIESLQQKLDAVQVGVGNWSESERKELGKRIDIYLKEIEKCLSLLNA